MPSVQIKANASMETNKKIVTFMATVLAGGVLTKLTNSNFVQKWTSKAGVAGGEMDLFVALSSILSLGWTFDIDILKRWSMGLPIATAIHKMWSSLWVRDLISKNEFIGKTLFNKEDIETSRKSYEMYQTALNYIYVNELSDDNKDNYNKHDAVVKSYNSEKRSEMAASLGKIATYSAVFPLYTAFVQKKFGVVIP
jgi:hypothetical protein